MSDFILVDGDQAVFLPNFGAAVVIVRPGMLSAGGAATRGGKKLCIVGDEKNVSVPGCLYTTPQYSIPGTGTLKIAALADDQKAEKTRSAGTAVMLKGSRFNAEFEIQSPAQQPPPGPGSPIPDPSPKYSGEGSFTTVNTSFRGT
ncbi:MAG: hypothetical protein ACU84J_13505 [Gammaproteobacteria bacterium]